MIVQPCSTIFLNMIQLNPDNSNLQGKSKKIRVISGVRVIHGKISKKITWREIEKGSS